MRPDMVIVRLGEMTLKGRNRGRFVKRVLQQLQPLQLSYPDVIFKQEFGRIHIELNSASYEAAVHILNRIFGLFSYSPAVRCSLELDHILEQALQLMVELQPPQGEESSFKMAVNRSNKAYPLDTMELLRIVGGHVQHNTERWRVDLHQPATTLHLDVREQEAYLFTEIVRGSGGYPLGSNGKAVLMLSGGIDSPVAGWLSMRMGLELEAVHFHSYPYTSERAKRKVEELTQVLSGYAGSIKLHMVPFTAIQLRLKEKGWENLLVICMKRAMMRIAAELAGQCKAGAIVTGESLGQVASQTLSSLDAIGRAVELPILRPLITMDKAEIVKLAGKIGTYDISIQPYEDCCTLFLPKAPSTNPGLRSVEKVENHIPELQQLIDEAVKGTETITVLPGGQMGNGQPGRAADYFA